jgi:hypothetical protein
MSEDDADETSQLLVTGEPNERLVIEWAIGVLQGKGHIEEADDELIETLRRLYHANPTCQTEVKFNGDILHDLCAARPGEYLAAAYEHEREEYWERHEAQRWSCPCGCTFGLYIWSEKHVNFYTLTDTGLFDTQTTTCPRCNRNLTKARSDHANGQLGFAF